MLLFPIFAMKKSFSTIIISLLICVGFQACRHPAVMLSPVGEGYSATSVNAAVFRGSSLVTHADTQYIAYYAPDGTVVTGKRKVGSSDWILHRTQYKGNVADAHNVISIGVDGSGVLHLSWDHHRHPLNYARAVAPGSIELGQKETMTGIDENDVTYPEFYCLPGGDLLFAYRSGASGGGIWCSTDILWQQRRGSGCRMC